MVGLREEPLHVALVALQKDVLTKRPLPVKDDVEIQFLGRRVMPNLGSLVANTTAGKVRGLIAMLAESKKDLQATLTQTIATLKQATPG
jgi:hypothetical protein